MWTRKGRETKFIKEKTKGRWSFCKVCHTKIKNKAKYL
jgi:hypothetical protein